MWRKLINLLRDEYGYSASQARGVIVLFGIILFILLLPAIWSFIKPQIIYHEHSRSLANGDRKELERFFEESKSPGTRNQVSYQGADQQQNYSYFDPNTDSKEELIEAGLPDYLAERIIKYRYRGGKFKTTDDLGKLYGLRPELFKKLKPFVKIQAVDSTLIKPKPQRDPLAVGRNIPLVDLNLADTVLLESLKGIGAKSASRIVRYRDRLGGFYHFDQLKEVYGIDSALFSAFKSQCTLDTLVNPLRKINITEAEAEQLSMHPYISRRQANILLAWRKQRGIKSLNDLVLSKAFGEEEVIRLAPYLTY